MSKRGPVRFDIHSWANGPRNPLDIAYSTARGVALIGKSEDLIDSNFGSKLKGKVQLIFTSPPFPLNKKKKYDNLQGEPYKKWLASYAVSLKELLTPDGSIVIEIGNAWEPGRPVMSLLALESLLEFKKVGNLHLCQEFIWHNPAKLPTPAQWVTVERIRVKDAFTRFWWMSSVPKPKADNRRVLTAYSGAMQRLLETKSYNAGRRPSEHVIGQTSFLTDNGGAIPPNVVTVSSEDTRIPSNVLVSSNTGTDGAYRRYCSKHNLDSHPARMPVDLAQFFVKLCTEPGDIVFDPFSGTNTTGSAAEALERGWISIEANADYAASGAGRF